MKVSTRRFGPGALVTAAFIGPGTVTVCTLAGVNDGYSLLWVMLIAIIVCYLLQEMAARLGVVARLGLAEALRLELSQPLLRFIMLGIVLAAIVVGNAAYEAGNISGATLGLQPLIGTWRIEVNDLTFSPVNLLIAALAFVLLYRGSYALLEKILISLVLLMSVAFLFVAITTRPSIYDLLGGFVPRMTANQTLTVIGLIGTTVVPYNLFLHARIVQERWSGPESLPAMRQDAALAIVLGGCMSMAIIVSAAAIQGTDVANAAQLALALEPVFGGYAKFILAFGLFAAGITSAITAPLAASYVSNGCLGWPQDLTSRSSRAVWITVLLAGLLFSMLGGSPIEIIRFAQITNGILLPLIAGFVLWGLNRKNLLGDYVNSVWQNLLGALVLLVVTVLAGRSLWLVVGTLRW